MRHFLITFHQISFQEYRFPESGEISYGDIPNPIETDNGEIRADPTNDDVTEPTEEDHSNPGEEENPEEKGGYYFLIKIYGSCPIHHGPMTLNNFLRTSQCSSWHGYWHYYPGDNNFLNLVHSKEESK